MAAFGQKRTVGLAEGDADRLLFQRCVSQPLLFCGYEGYSGCAATLDGYAYAFGVSVNGHFVGAVTCLPTSHLCLQRCLARGPPRRSGPRNTATSAQVQGFSRRTRARAHLQLGLRRGVWGARACRAGRVGVDLQEVLRQRGRAPQRGEKHLVRNPGEVEVEQDKQHA